MSLRAPVVSGVLPTVNDTDVVLRPTIEIKVGGEAFVVHLRGTQRRLLSMVQEMWSSSLVLEQS